MDILIVNNLTFAYTSPESIAPPDKKRTILSNISFSIKPGSFVTLCGATGSGKSTLLKLLKGELCPAGEMSGSVLMNGRSIQSSAYTESSKEIGFLFQNPDDQFVTDKVWHEIVFGMENLGFSKSKIEKKLAEVLAFFRLENISDADTDSLSGGQKQLVNLASIVAMEPKLLLLDEPTSALDPEAADQFLAVLKKLQLELGLTIIVAEHNLKNVLPLSDSILILENGKLVGKGAPSSGLKSLSASSPIYGSLPLCTRLALEEDSASLPLSVLEGRTYISDNTGAISKLQELMKATSLHTIDQTPTCLKLKDIYFRYQKNSRDILRGLSAAFTQGNIYSILGCNASGKTTLLNIITGLLNPQEGSVSFPEQNERKGFVSRSPKKKLPSIGYLPQNTELVFLRDSLKEEYKVSGIDTAKLPTYLANLSPDQGPMDLSGGERQLLAICKIAATQPQIFIMDEPTRGMDQLCKEAFITLLKDLKDMGTTLIMASHDIEFSAAVSDYCAIMSSGRLTSFEDSSTFFKDNTLYTTELNRLTKGIIEC